MVELRDSLTGASDEWGHSIPDELSDSPPDDWLWRGLGRAKNNGGRPFTQYWFAKHLFWRLDSGMPMRLMIYLPTLGEASRRAMYMDTETGSTIFSQERGFVRATFG